LPPAIAIRKASAACRLLLSRAVERDDIAAIVERGPSHNLM
jgi:hypothetical protein